MVQLKLGADSIQANSDLSTLGHLFIMSNTFALALHSFPVRVRPHGAVTVRPKSTVGYCRGGFSIDC